MATFTRQAPSHEVGAMASATVGIADAAA